jgi:hypothetical protein
MAGIDQLATLGTAAANSTGVAPQYRAYCKKERKAEVRSFARF